MPPTGAARFDRAEAPLESPVAATTRPSRNARLLAYRLSVRKARCDGHVRDAGPSTWQERRAPGPSGKLERLDDDGRVVCATFGSAHSPPSVPNESVRRPRRLPRTAVCRSARFRVAARCRPVPSAARAWEGPQAAAARRLPPDGRPRGRSARSPRRRDREPARFVRHDPVWVWNPLRREVNLAAAKSRRSSRSSRP